MTARIPEMAPGRDDRHDERPERREWHGHRREYGARQPTRTVEARVDGVVRDVGVLFVTGVWCVSAGCGVL